MRKESKMGNQRNKKKTNRKRNSGGYTLTSSGRIVVPNAPAVPLDSKAATKEAREPAKQHVADIANEDTADSLSTDKVVVEDDEFRDAQEEPDAALPSRTSSDEFEDAVEPEDSPSPELGTASPNSQEEKMFSLSDDEDDQGQDTIFGQAEDGKEDDDLKVRISSLVPSVSQVRVSTRGGADEYLVGTFQEYREFDDQEFLMVDFPGIGIQRVRPEDIVYQPKPKRADDVDVPNIIVTPAPSTDAKPSSATQKIAKPAAPPAPPSSPANVDGDSKSTIPSTAPPARPPRVPENRSHPATSSNAPQVPAIDVSKVKEMLAKSAAARAAAKAIPRDTDVEMADGETVVHLPSEEEFDLNNVKVPSEEGLRTILEGQKSDDSTAFIDYCRIFQSGRIPHAMKLMCGSKGDPVLKAAAQFVNTVMAETGDQYALAFPDDRESVEYKQKFQTFVDNLDFLKTVAIDVFRTLSKADKDESLNGFHASCLHGAALIFERKLIRCQEINCRPDAGDRALYFHIWAGVAKSYYKAENYTCALACATKVVRMFEDSHRYAKEGFPNEDSPPAYIMSIIFNAHILRARVCFHKKRAEEGLNELEAAIDVQYRAGKLFSQCYREIGEVSMAHSTSFPSFALRFAEVLLYLIHRVDGVEGFVSTTAIEFVNRFLMNQIFHLLKNGYPEQALIVTRCVREKFKNGSLWLHEYMLARALLDARKSRAWSRSEIEEVEETTLDLARRAKCLEVCFIIDDLVFTKSLPDERAHFVQLALEVNHIMVGHPVSVANQEAINQIGEARKRMILQCQAILIEVLPEGLQWCNDQEARAISKKALTCLLKNLETIPSQCLQKDELTSLINLVISTCEHCTRKANWAMAIQLCLATVPLVRAAPSHCGVVLFKEMIDNLIALDNPTEALAQAQECVKIFPCAEASFLSAYLHASMSQEFGAVEVVRNLPISSEPNGVTRDDLVLLIRAAVDKNLPNLFKAVLDVCNDVVFRHDLQSCAIPIVIQHAFEVPSHLMLKDVDINSRHPFKKKYTDHEKSVYQIELMEMYCLHVYREEKESEATLQLIDTLHKVGTAHAHTSFMSPHEHKPQITERFGEVYLKLLDCLKLENHDLLSKGYHILLSARCALIDKFLIPRKDTGEAEDTQSTTPPTPLSHEERKQLVDAGKECAQRYWFHVHHQFPDKPLHERKTHKPKVCSTQIDCQVALMEVFVLLEEECFAISSGGSPEECQQRLRPEIEDCVTHLDKLGSEGKLHTLRRRIKQCEVFPALEREMVDRIFKFILQRGVIDAPERLIEVWTDMVEKAQAQEPGSSRLLSTVELIVPFAGCKLLPKRTHSGPSPPPSEVDDSSADESTFAFTLPLASISQVFDICLAYGADSLANDDVDFARRWINCADNLRKMVSTDRQDEASQQAIWKLGMDLQQLRIAANQKSFPPVPVFTPSQQTTSDSAPLSEQSPPVIQRSHVPSVKHLNARQPLNHVSRSSSCPGHPNVHTMHHPQFPPTIITAESSPRSGNPGQPMHPAMWAQRGGRVSLPPRPPMMVKPGNMVLMPMQPQQLPPGAFVTRRVSGPAQRVLVPGQSYSMPSSPTGVMSHPIRPYFGSAATYAPAGARLPTPPQAVPTQAPSPQHPPNQI